MVERWNRSDLKISQDAKVGVNDPFNNSALRASNNKLMLADSLCDLNDDDAMK